MCDLHTEDQGLTTSTLQHKEDCSKTSKKTQQARASVFERLGSLKEATIQKTITQDQSFCSCAGKGVCYRPVPAQHRKARGAASASSAGSRWQVAGGGSPGRLCPTVAKFTGDLSGHQHRRRGVPLISTSTLAHPSVHHVSHQEQPPGSPAGRGCPAVLGSHRKNSQRVLSRVLQPAVPGAEEDGRSTSSHGFVHAELAHGGASLQDGNPGICQSRHQKPGVDSLYPHKRCVSSCPDAQGRQKVFAIYGQHENVPMHLSLLRIGHFTSWVYKAVVALLRQWGVKLHVYLDDWLIRADTPDEAQMRHAQMTISLIHYLGWIINLEKSDLTPSQDFQFIGMQFNTRQFTVAPLPKMRPVRSPTLDDQPCHYSPRSAQVAGHGGVQGGTGPTGKTSPPSSPVVGRHSCVPEDRELVRQDFSSSVGSVRGGLVGICGSPARSTPRLQGNGSHSLHGCVQFGLGSPVRVTLDTGTVVCISKIVTHKRPGDAGCHQHRESLPSSRSSEIPGGSFDVRQRCDRGVHQDRVGHTILHSHAGDDTPAEVVRSQGDKTGSRPSARSKQHPGRFTVQSRPDSEWMMAMEHPRPVFAKWGEPQVDLYVTFANRRLIRLASPYPDPRAEFTDALSVPWDNGRGFLYAFPLFKMVPQVLQKVTQSEGVQMILIARLQETASWFLKLLDLSQEDPIPLHIEGQPIFTHGDSAGHPSGEGPFPGGCWDDVKVPSRIITSHAWIVHFCRSKRWHVFRVRSHNFSTYMMHPFRDVLLPLTIISHRTSVASVLLHWEYNPAADPHIKLLVRAIQLERPVQWRIMPKCNLHLILSALMSPPFVSEFRDEGETFDDVIPLKWWTMKTVFLLALA